MHGGGDGAATAATTASDTGGGGELSQAEKEVARKAREYKEAQARLRAARTEAVEQKKREFDEQKRQAEQAIEDARGQRGKVRIDIQEAYAAQAAQKAAGEKLSNEIWEAQQQRVAEELLFKKLRLEQMQKKRQDLQRALQSKQEELQVVSLEINRRDGNTDHELQQALEHADQLKAALAAAEESGLDLKSQWLKQQNLARENMGRGAGTHASDRSEFRLVDELLAHRQRDFHTSTRDQATKLQQLNHQRSALRKQRQESASRRKEMSLLISKGGDYLAEIEIGKAPPLAYINMNLQKEAKDSGTSVVAGDGATNAANSVNEGTVTSPDGDDGDGDSDSSDGETLEEMLARLQTEVTSGQSKILEELRASINPAIEEIEINVDVDLWSDAYKFCSSVIYEVFDDVWKECYIEIPRREKVEQDMRWWELQGKILLQEISRRTDADAAWSVLMNLVDEVVEQTIRGLYDEVMALSALGNRIARTILLDAIGSQANASDKQKIASAFDQLLAEREASARKNSNRASNTPLGKDDFNYRHSSAVSIGTSGIAVSSGPGKTKIPTAKREDAADARINEQQRGAVQLRSGQSRRLIELSGRSGVSSLAFSPAGNMLAVGRADGELSIWWTGNAAQNPKPSQVRKNNKTGISMMELGWSDDSSTLYVIDKEFSVTIWSLQPDMTDKNAKIRQLVQQTRIDPSVFQPDATELQVAGQRGEYCAYTACFHPSRTVLGSQPALMLGMLSGELVKCNSRLVDKVVAGKPPLPLSDCTIPLKAASPIHEVYYSSAERFVGHTGAIIFVDHTPSFSMVTVDRTGNVMAWPYTKDQYTGFNWFQPAAKVTLNLDYIFEPIPDAPVRTVFPSTDLTVPSNPLFDPIYLDAVEAETARVTALEELRAAPTNSSVTETGNQVLTYAPAKIPEGDDQRVECTLLEYGSCGAGAGLLVRHAKQQCRLDRSSRGAVEAAALTTSRRDLLVMLSTQTSKSEPSKLSIVKLHVETMEWMPLRIEVDNASENFSGAMQCGAMNILDGQEDCLMLLLEQKVLLYSATSGQQLLNVAPDGGPCQVLSFVGARSDQFQTELSIALASPSRNKIELCDLQTRITRQRPAVVHKNRYNLESVEEMAAAESQTAEQEPAPAPEPEPEPAPEPQNPSASPEATEADQSTEPDPEPHM